MVWQSGQGFSRCGLVGFGSRGEIRQAREGRVRVWPGSRGTDVLGRVGCDAAGICKGVERFDEVWSHPAGSVQRRGALGQRGERSALVRQEFAKARWGSDACGMFRQSRWGQDGYGRMGIEKVRQGEAVEEFNG